MGNFSDAAGVSSNLRGAFWLPADRGRTVAQVRATCPGLPVVQGTSVPASGLMANAYQHPVLGQAPARKPFIYTTRVDAVGVKGSHPAREPV